MSDLPRIIFMGSDPVALPMLEHLRTQTDRMHLAGVVTQPDRRSGRGMALTRGPIKTWAHERKIPLLQPAIIDHLCMGWLRDMKPDLIIVMAFGQILRQELLDLPRLGCVNLHGSLLPAYRGASPLETALAQGETHTGVTLMRIVRALDAGPICDSQSFPIDASDQAGDLYRKAANACVPLIERNLDALLDGTAAFKPQDPALVSYCRLLTRDDAAIDFTLPAATVAARVRAFTPWPGGAFHARDTVVKVAGLQPLPEAADATPGTILGLRGEGLAVACGDGTTLAIGELQKPGSRMMPARDFLNGFPLPTGTVLASTPAYPLVSDRHFRRPG